MPDDSTWYDATPGAPDAGPDLRSLHYLAFERNNAAAFDQWQTIDPRAQREALLDRHVFVAVLTASAQRLRALDPDSRLMIVSYAERIQRSLGEVRESMVVRQIPFATEWFQGLERWADALVAHHLFDFAERTLQIAYATGSARFAGVHQALRATEALLLATTGRREDAAQIAMSYALRPYLQPDRRLRPQINRRLMAALVLAGRVTEYRTLLWRGLSDVYFDGETRAWFVQQACATYRGAIRTLLRHEVPASLRLQFALQLAGKTLGRLRLARWLRLDRALDWANFVLAYCLQYGRAPRRAIPWQTAQSEVADRILVTRAMGGLGDLLMMTPGLRALRNAHPDTPIHFAIPRGYFPLFLGNPDVDVIDVEAPDLDPAQYRCWYDLTDCPAARVEARQMPNVRRDRVQIFAAAMGVRLRELKRSGFAPRYDIAAEEAAFARAFVAGIDLASRPVVGIQLHSAESYRDFPHNQALALDLSRDCCVLLFDNLPIEGFDSPNLHKVVLPLRQSFAVAAQCDVLIAPDSSFVHLGAALNKPVVAIFGPIDGTVRCRRFPTVSVLSPAKDEFYCAPCWRNEYTPCGLTGQRESACLRSIDPQAVADRARQLASVAV